MPVISTVYILTYTKKIKKPQLTPKDIILI